MARVGPRLRRNHGIRPRSGISEVVIRRLFKAAFLGAVLALSHFFDLCEVLK